MGLFTSTEFDSLECLLIDQLQDLYDAENRLMDALPKMADAASSSKLKQAFQSHLEETKGQVNRLEQAFQLLEKSAKRKSCEAMKGLVKEGEEIINAKGDPAIKDAALIAAAQRVEHYEMAGYGSARNFAQRCGRPDVADLLQQTLQEEGDADKKLSQIAESSINAAAARV
ncbi:ferritin-like domain-containing protein [Novipirellula caenicola]|uniref:Protein YciF n=1 Tax=Novipirellula caenicola TaxID=1536901 RepID=A0ABP9VLD6_9BACT